MQKRLLCLTLALCLALACTVAARADIVDSWYEVFVYSFADGDGDRLGDLAGLTDRLDYIADMGFGGIWLMPIHPSPSYHKYDVTDYYGIDPQYGTLEDFEAMLSRAHDLGIRVIIDLVVNHTSNAHPWFQSAKDSAASPYRDYYNFADEPAIGYTALPGGLYYESRFVSTMPDLNLDSPAVRAEIEAILRYWLDMGVDGFRLDAVTSYYTGNRGANIDFLRWLNDTAKAIDPDCFIVGECWDSLGVIREYYQSGVDSFFTFPVAQGGGYIAKILGGSEPGKGERYGEMTLLLQEALDGLLPAPFLGNHDTPRIASILGTHTPTGIKMAAGLLAMMRGSIFVYYGDEIGMTGSANDPEKRLGMFWDEKKSITFAPPGTAMLDYPFGSVAEQMDRPSSVLNYYRQAMHLREAFPMIARGVSTVLDSPDPEVCIIQRELAGETLLIVINLSIDEVTLDVPEGFASLAGELQVWGEAALVDGQLSIPAYGIVLMQ